MQRFKIEKPKVVVYPQNMIEDNDVLQKITIKKQTQPKNVNPNLPHILKPFVNLAFREEIIKIL